MYDPQPIVCLRYSETPLQYVVGKLREKRKEREKEKGNSFELGGSGKGKKRNEKG